AGVPAGLRGAGPAGPAGGAELRAVPAGAGPARVSGAAAQADRAAAATVAAAVGEELADVGAEAVPGQGAATGPDAAGGVIRGPAGKRPGLRRAGVGQDALAVRDRPGAGAGGAEGTVLHDGSAGAGAAGGQAGPEAV